MARRRARRSATRSRPARACARAAFLPRAVAAFSRAWNCVVASAAGHRGGHGRSRRCRLRRRVFDLIIAVRVVDDIDAAIAHIRRSIGPHGSHRHARRCRRALRRRVAVGRSHGQRRRASPTAASWPRCGNRHIYDAPARVRSDGRRSADDRALCDPRRRAGPPQRICAITGQPQAILCRLAS